MQRLSFSIASIPFVVELEEGAVATALGGAWGAFAGPAQLGARSIRFRPDGRRPPEGARTMPRREGATILGGGFTAELNGDHAEVRGADERFGVESVLKLMLAEALLPRGGVLVHGVGLSTGPCAAVLLGESGAGKSTLGALGAEHGLTLLSDELVALLDGRAWATPWNTGSGGSASLTLLGTLGWAQSPSLAPVPAADFLPLMLANTLLPDERPETRAELFRQVSRLLNQHPPQRFFFSPDDRAAKFLTEQLRSR